MTTPRVTSHRVELRWYCTQRDTKLCFHQEETLTGVSHDKLEDARKKLYALPFSKCPCGEKIDRSMHIYEETL